MPMREPDLDPHDPCPYDGGAGPWPADWSAPRRREHDLCSDGIVRLVARSFRVSPATLVEPRRARARDALARHAAMYLMHVALGVPHAEIGDCFGRHRTSVRYACARIEDRRDDPDFDARLDRLEARLRALFGSRP